jgi:hypothetical protein
VGRGLGQRQRQFLAALESLDADDRQMASKYQREPRCWHPVWDVVNEVYRLFYQAEHERQQRKWCTEVIEEARRTGDTQRAALAKMLLWTVGDNEQDGGNARRLAPVANWLERRLNPSQLLRSLALRGLIERRYDGRGPRPWSYRGPGSTVRLLRRR